MKDKIPAEVLFVILAIVGGIARYLDSYINGDPLKFSHFVANVVVSAFAGFMFALFGQSLGLSNNMLIVMAGIGGYMGTEALKFLVQKIKDKFTT